MNVTDDLPSADADPRRRRAGILISLIFLATFCLDLVSPLGFVMWAPYLLAIFLSASWKGKPAILLTVAAACILVLIGALLSPSGSLGAGITNLVIGIGLILLTGMVGLRREDLLQSLREETRRHRDSDSRFRKLIETSPTGELLVDSAGRIALVNSEVERLFGYPREELIGRPVEMLLPQRHRERHVGYRSQYFESPRFGVMSEGPEVFGLRKDGREIPVDIRLSHMHTDDGAFALATVIDISVQRSLVEQLRLSEERFQRAIEGSSDGLWEWNILTQAVWYSPRFFELLGHAVGEFPGTFESFETRLHPEDRARVMEAVRSHLEDDQPYDVRYRLRRKDGKYLWFRARGAARRDDAGEPVLMSGSIQDIHDLVAAEESLARQAASAGRLAVLNRLNAVSVEVSNARSLREAVQIITDTSRELIGAHQALMRIVRDGDAAAVQTLSMSDRFAQYAEYDAIPKGRRIDDWGFDGEGTVRMTHEDVKSNSDGGEDRLCEQRLPNSGWLATTILARNGRKFGFLQLSDKYEGEFTEEDVGLLEQLSQMAAGVVELHEANERLEEKVRERTVALTRSNEDLEQFAYVASHDLQEPLRAVAGYCQLLEMDYADALGDEARDYIDHAVAGTNRMQTLINDLLEYSRIGRKGQPFVTVNLNDVVDQVREELSMLVSETGARIVSEDLPTVHGDQVQLVQLLENLIGNGIKYCRSAVPRVEVSARRDDGRWVVAVRDNGIGIAAEFRERIFKIFQRLHTRDEYTGTGIGLAICKRIVDRHGGRIWVESAVGYGSTFYFTLPETPLRADTVLDGAAIDAAN